MKKKILAVIGIITITAAMLAGCSSKDVEADAEASTEPVSQAIGVSDTTKPAESTTVAESTTAETTTEKTTTTTTKAAAKQSQTTSAPKIIAKQTTKSTTAATTKATTQATTKATVKNVSAKDVQAQVNSYIRSKGITVDSSLNSGNSGWSGRISATRQDSLNDGTSLRNCKSYVDSEISSMGSNISLYCYYDGTFFYICYMMNWG
ncbi:MAG: hypothetical protein K2J41_00715 [Eubacterium sp.]|nr:hypothetical protein [Eubacterium sp.]